jgi:enoyl-CoA hydratase/carnithine racemase
VKELVFTAKLIEAEEAEQLGLVNDVVSRKKLDARVEQLIENIQSNAPGAVKNSKRALNYSVQSTDMDAAREHAHSVWWDQFRSDEREQRVDQFLE